MRVKRGPRISLLEDGRREETVRNRFCNLLTSTIILHYITQYEIRASH